MTMSRSLLHEAGGRCRPAGVGVQHGDHYRHVSAPDGHYHMDTENQRDRGHHHQAVQGISLLFQRR